PVSSGFVALREKHGTQAVPVSEPRRTHIKVLEPQRMAVIQRPATGDEPEHKYAHGDTEAAVPAMQEGAQQSPAMVEESGTMRHQCTNWSNAKAARAIFSIAATERVAPEM